MKTLTETAIFSIDAHLSEDNATSIALHLIKHNYRVSKFEGKGNFYVIRATRTFIVFPESPRVKIDDLIDIFDKAIDQLKETGKINIEIDQGVGALDISLQSIKETQKAYS